MGVLLCQALLDDNKNAKLKVENLAQTPLRFSPVSFLIPDEIFLHKDSCFFDSFLEML
jgi:hypothetical protein